MRSKIKFLLCTILLSSVYATVFSQKNLRPLPKSKNDFIVIAHRGSHLVKPENTIASIEEAMEFGADYVEIDVRTTRDGKLVLLHNETVDKMTDGKGRVQDFDFAQLKQLTLTGKDGSLHKIASFEDALKACKGKINIYLDFKAADVAETYLAIKLAGMENQVLVYTNGLENYNNWRKLAPKMPLMSGLPKNIRTKEELLTLLEKMPIEAVDNLPAENLLPTLKALGVSVFLDVQQAVESPEDWNKAMRKGVQGVQTDHPKALIDFLNANKLRNGLIGASE